MSNGFADYDAALAYSRMGGKTSERAVLIVNGQLFEDWETVSVTQSSRESPPYKFRFTCSEGEPIAKNYAVLRIKPGMDCVIYLAGYKAFSGKVISRQVFYDARRHHIEIQGSNDAFVVTQTSVISKTGEFLKVNYEQLAKAILRPLNVPFKVEGTGSLPTYTFGRVSVPPGQYAGDLLEQYARHVGIHLTSNNNGDFVAIAGTRADGGNDFVEGQNILEGREIIMNRAYLSTANLGNIPATDQKWGPPTTSVPFVDSDPTGLIKNQVARPGYSVLMNEIPVWGKEPHEKRNNFESQISDQDEIWVTVTVYGWLKPSGGLWGPPVAKARVTSPMLIMQNKELLIKSINFTQDNRGGTRTTLELMNEAAAGTGAGRGRIDELPTAESATPGGFAGSSEGTAAGTIPPGG